MPTLVRRQPSTNKSPVRSSEGSLSPSLGSRGYESSNGSNAVLPNSTPTAPHRVTETHHITKDYDSRTGAKTINRYEFQETIGRGVHGKVKLAKDIETGELVAIKIVNRITKKRLGRRWNPMEAEEKVRREIAIMKKCVHPNVVALREVMDDPDSKKIYLGTAPPISPVLFSDLETVANDVIVLEYMSGGQLQWRDSDDNPVLNIEQIRSIIRDTVLGLQYLHYQGIIHRDIKPANLLLDANHHVKISDFGVSHLAKVDEETGELLTENDLELSKTAGSPAFFAPELCQAPSGFWDTKPGEVQDEAKEFKKPNITKAIDVWALGITLYCLLFGRTPFPETGVEFQLFNMICNDAILIPPPEFEESDVDDEVKDLLKRLLEKDPDSRITLEEVKHHPFILRNIPDPGKWMEDTDLRHTASKLEVTPEEVSAAVSLTERVKRTLYKIQTSLSGLTGLRRRATTGRSTPSGRSTSVSTIEPSSPDSRYLNSRRGSQISVDSFSYPDNDGRSKDRHSTPSLNGMSKNSPPQSLSRKPSSATSHPHSSGTSLPTPTNIPPLQSTNTDPAPLRPSRSLRSTSRGRSTMEYSTGLAGIPRSRAVSDLSGNLNGETNNVLMDDYSEGVYFDDIPPQTTEEESEEEDTHFMIDFGKRRSKVAPSDSKPGSGVPPQGTSEE